MNHRVLLLDTTHLLVLEFNFLHVRLRKLLLLINRFRRRIFLYNRLPEK